MRWQFENIAVSGRWEINGDENKWAKNFGYRQIVNKTGTSNICHILQATPAMAILGNWKNGERKEGHATISSQWHVRIHCFLTQQAVWVQILWRFRLNFLHTPLRGNPDVPAKKRPGRELELKLPLENTTPQLVFETRWCFCGRGIEKTVAWCNSWMS